MNHLLIFVLFNILLIQSGFCNISNSKADSLYSILHKAPIESKYNIHIKLSKVFKNNFDSALFHAKKALNLAENSGEDTIHFASVINIGDVYLNEKAYDIAKEYYFAALSLSASNRNSKYADALTNIGTVLFYEQKLDEAAKYFNEALVIYRQHGDLEGSANCLNNLGVIHYMYGDSESAFKNYEKAIEIKKEAGNNKDYANALSNMAIIYQESGNYDKATEKYIESINTFKRIKNHKKAADLYNNLGLLMKDKGNNSSALKYYKKAEFIYDSLNMINEKSTLYNNLGNLYTDQGAYKKAVKYYSDAIDIKKQLKDSLGQAVMLHNLAGIYEEMGNTKQALELYKNSLTLKKQTGNIKGIVTTLINIANIYTGQNNIVIAEQNYNEALSLAKEYNLDEEKARLLHNLGVLYEGKGNYDKALNFYFKSLSLKQGYSPKGIAQTMLNIGNIYKIKDQYDKAKQYIEQSLELSIENDFTRLTMLGYKNLSEINHLTGNCTEALNLYIKHSAIKDSIYSYENRQRLFELQARYESEAKEKEIQLLNKQKEIQKQQYANQRIIIYAVTILTILLILLLILLYNRFRIKKRISSILLKQNKSIIKQQKEIKDSIEYAQSIQNAILSSKDIPANLFEKLFIIYMPRDIVSGDFHYIKQIQNKTFIIAADCTGHGVPGAFMSMLGMAFLNEIITKDAITTPASILEKLREAIITSLHQSGKEGESKDGMDMSVCVINNTNSELQYAGANNPVYIISNNELNELKPDRMPVGFHYKTDQKFTQKTIIIKKNDIIYQFSDGYADSFGGLTEEIRNKGGKKLKYKRFKQILLENSQYSLKIQKERLIEEHEKWIGSLEQVDDIIIIGYKH